MKKQPITTLSSNSVSEVIFFFLYLPFNNYNRVIIHLFFRRIFGFPASHFSIFFDLRRVSSNSGVMYLRASNNTGFISVCSF